MLNVKPIITLITRILYHSFFKLTFGEFPISSTILSYVTLIDTPIINNPIMPVKTPSKILNLVTDVITTATRAKNALVTETRSS
jgi:hypothetical protein